MKTTIANIKANLIKNRDRLTAATQFALGVVQYYVIYFVLYLVLPAMIGKAIGIGILRYREVRAGTYRRGKLISDCIYTIIGIGAAIYTAIESFRRIYAELEEKADVMTTAFSEYKRKYKSESTFELETEHDYSDYAVE